MASLLLRQSRSQLLRHTAKPYSGTRQFSISSWFTGQSSTPAAPATPDIPAILTTENDVNNVQVQEPAETVNVVTNSVQAASPDVIENLASISTASADATVATFRSVSELGYYPTDLFIQAMDVAHSVTGLPWWVTIIGVTVGTRALLFPVIVNSMRQAATMSKLKPQLEVMQEEMKENPSVEARQKMLNFYKKHDINPLTAIVGPLVQVPIFMSFFFGLRRMGEYFPSFATEGAYWFTDLTVADPTMILPITCATSMLATTYLGQSDMQTPMSGNIKKAMYAMSVVMVPLTYQLPAGVFVYWVASNGVSLTQSALFRVPGVKQSLGIEQPDVDTSKTVNPTFTKSMTPFQAAVAQSTKQQTQVATFKTKPRKPKASK